MDWTEVTINSWEEYQHLVKDLNPKKWVFRGQSDLRWKLETSFFRAVSSVRDIKTSAKQRIHNRDGYEKEIINLFKSQYHLYLSYNPDNNADFIIELTKNNLDESNTERTLEWLSIMQHYGVPTRLLDWTFSPYVALFFALENATNDCCVYALDQERMQILDKNTYEDNYKKEIFENRKGEKSFLRPYEPKFKNERLVRQQGLFMVPSTNFETFDTILNQYGLSEDGGYKIIITKDLRYNLFLMLKRLNITHETLFPGIEGFCRSLKFTLLETASNIKRLV